MQDNFNPLDDAINIKKSFIKPKNMNGLIHIIAHRSNAQRQEIKNQYFQQNNKNLIDDLKKELSGNFQDAAIALFYTPLDYDCYQLYKAMKGLGTNEDTLIEVIATRSNERINQIKRRYLEMYNRELLKDIESDTSGFFRQMLKKLLEANRSNNPYPDEKDSEICAKQLFDAANQKKEVLHETFMNIFTQKSREELASISKVYFRWYSKTLFEVIEKLFSGDAKRILKAIVYALLSPSEYFAYRINKAIKGFGTNDTILIRVLVSRDEIDIGRIKRYYKQLYQKDLYTAVKEDVSGDYRNLLLELIGN